MQGAPPIDRNAWGDTRAFSVAGIHRFRATATLEPGTAWQQPVTSPNKEIALRICDKRIVTTAGDPQRNNYVEWISTYEAVPYEWGGEYYGGLDSNGQYAGGDATYEQYAIDCSGLVSNGAYRAGYNWHIPVGGGKTTWRANCARLATGYCSTAVSDADFDEGDILLRTAYDPHVASCSYRDPAYPNKIKIIHASWSKAQVIKQDSTIQTWTTQGYTLRRLLPH